MKINKINFTYKIIIILILVLSNLAFSQINSDKKIELKNKILNTKNLEEPNFLQREEEKSPAVSVLLSLVLPGAGHFYSNRMDVGKYFLTAEAGLWLTIVGVNLYGDVIRDDAMSFAVVHSGINKNGKDDDYFVNIGIFNNIYEYNNYRLSRGEYDKIYDINNYFWNWDFTSNRELYEEQRKKSERVYNSERIFTAGLIINRIASAISAYLLTNTSSDLKISSEFNSFRNGKLNGFELRISKLF